jgi:hypothetical protein
MKKFVLLAAIVCGLSATSAQAQVVLDQIGVNPADSNGPNAYASQRFEAANVTFNIGSVDNFTIPAGGSRLVTLVETVVRGFGTAFVPTSFNNIQNYAVEIYSSRAASGVNLVGDVASVTIPAASAVVVPYGTSTLQRLIALDMSSLSVNLAPGNYFLAVIPRLDFAGNGQTGIVGSTFAGGFPNDANAYQANPGGGFGFTGTPPGTQDIVPPANLMYRLTVAPVPEPTSMALVGLVSAAGFGWRRWRKR